MSFTPLYKLFTTKEDRFAVYKAMELGMKPRKSKDVFEDFTNLLSDKDYEMGAIAERFNTSSVATGKSKAAELAESAGVDLLTIKQLIFCDLMANSDVGASDFQPFMCSTVGEIDALGKRAFGYRWGEANADNNTSIIVSYFSSALRRVMTKNKMCTITHPVVYPEMLREDKLYNGLGVLTLVACFLTAASLSHQTRYHDWGSSALKDYLTNKPDRVVRERLEKRIEEGFFLNLLCLRAEKYCEHAITGDVYGQIFAEGAVAHFIQEVNTPEAWDAYRRALLDCDSYREVAKCDFAFKHDYPFSRGTYEERAFFVDEIWFRYLKKDYANLLTSVCLADDSEYWIVVSERECWPVGYHEDNDKKRRPLRRKIFSPLVSVPKSVGSGFKYDIDLPWDVDREPISDALIYTAFLDRVFWDWDFTEKAYSNQPYKSMQAENCKPVMLITNSCYISPLRRKGATLYFVFRTEDSKASPLVLYVDNEEDKKFVEESAKSVGASLSNGRVGTGKNRVEVLPSKASTKMYDFPELNADLDQISKGRLFEELLRSTFLALMLSQSQTMFARRGDKSGFLREWAYSTVAPRERTTFAKSVFTITDKGVVRNVVPASYIETNVEDSYLSDFGCQIFRLNERDMIGDHVETCQKIDCLAFVSAEALSLYAKDSGRIEFAFVYLPILFKGKCYKYVRWEEIPAIVPEWTEEWSYIDSLSIPSLKLLFSTYSGIDLRRC